MAHISQARPAASRARRRHGPLFAPFLVFLGVAFMAAGYVGYVLWPRWPGVPVSLTAPALPIVVGGEMFNIEPAAIRQGVQRKAGAQPRVDLAYLWPSLTPPDPEVTPDVAHPVDPNERLFITIAEADASLPPAERVKTIYPRYLAEKATSPSEGLTVRAFRDGTPYQGEDLIFADAAPDDLTARCTRTGIGNTGMCLLQRRIGHADVTIRFPRDWIVDWKKALYGIDSVMARLHPDAK